MVSFQVDFSLDSLWTLGRPCRLAACAPVAASASGEAHSHKLEISEFNRFLSEKTGIPLEAMLGIGDTRGDLPFLEVVGIATGPANASADVKRVADFIAESEGPAGVIEILRRYTAWE